MFNRVAPKMAMPQQPLPNGQRVLIEGLTSAAGEKLNGQCGQIVGFDAAAGRHFVMVDGIGEPVRVLLGNLAPVSPLEL
eukprot:gene4497-4734_t